MDPLEASELLDRLLHPGLVLVGVELIRRGGWLFAINHGDDEQPIPGGLRLPSGSHAVQKVRKMQAGGQRDTVIP
ncbi:hypothetical protein GCM10023075_26620 [Streptosporangium album]